MTDYTGHYAGTTKGQLDLEEFLKMTNRKNRERKKESTDDEFFFSYDYDI